VLVALGLGTIADRAIGGPATIAWGLAALALGAASLLAHSRPRVAFALLTAALAAAGGGYHHYRWFDLDADDLAAVVGDQPEPAWVRGHVEEVIGLRTREGRAPGQPARIRTRFILRVEGVSDGASFTPRSGRADVSVQGDRTDLAAGEPVRVAGRISRVAGPLNPGEFDRRAFLQAQGIRLAMAVDEPSGVTTDPDGAWSGGAGWLGAIRAWSRDHLIDGLDPRAAPLASALVLGRRDDIDPEVVDAFARTGTTHLLAVSGLQLQVMAWAVGMALVVIGVPRRLRYILVASAAVGYALLVGCSPSVTRSMVMTVAFCAALFASRTTGPADALALAGVLTIVGNPSAVFDVGCQLSFLAVGALFWLMPAAGKIEEASRLRLLGPPDPLDELEAWHQALGSRLARWAGRHAMRLAAASAIVWAVAAPLSALRFHIVSPMGILLNVPLVPMTSMALLAGAFKLAMAALAALLAGLATPAAWLAGPLALALGLAERLAGGLERSAGVACGGLLRGVEVVATRGAAIPWGTWFSPGPPAASVATFYVLLPAAVYLMHAGPRRDAPSTGLRWGRRIAWGLAFVWCVPGWWLMGPRKPADLEADVLAVGHGLAVVIATPEGKTFLYDCGRMDDPGVGRRIVAPALWSRGVSRIDAVFLSHADNDHYNGLPDVLDRFEVGEVVVSEGFLGLDNPAALALLRRVRARGVPAREAVAPSSRPSGSTRIDVIHPPAGWESSSDNARSLTLDVSRHGRRLLLTGDLEQVGLAELLSKPEPGRPIDVLLSPHHGARGANPPRLFEWARPRVVVASQKPPTAGVADALTPLEAGDIVLLRTWRTGAVSLRWSPEGVSASGYLDSR
jgi:competence protein ComEC